MAATPIGNLGDASPRLAAVLAGADVVLCEDTRETGKLCAALGVKAALLAYHDHNAERVRPAALARLAAGEAVCLVSDAGTPLISDPGYKLVRAARDAEIPVFAVPGPSAAIAALSVAGAPTDRFFFAGFPPAKPGAREAFFAGLNAIDATLIFYETGPRLAASLAAMADAFGDRRAAVARELTKRFEETVEGSLATLAERYASAPPKGEIVVVVHPPAAPPADAADLDAFLADALQSMSVKDAAAAAADALGVAKKTAYAAALALQRAGRDP
ncbi:MAG: 16S rRNA (cytidine(1402)-2'-O)-methyltransferase [Pseudomonadota bacterium]